MDLDCSPRDCSDHCSKPYPVFKVSPGKRERKKTYLSTAIVRKQIRFNSEQEVVNLKQDLMRSVKEIGEANSVLSYICNC